MDNDGSVAGVSEPQHVLDNWWLYASELGAPELRWYLRRYKYGDIRRWSEGANDLPKRAPRICFVGDHYTGKSSLINSLKAAWEGPINSPLAYEHATVGSKETIGTVCFEGPFNLVVRDGKKTRTVLELYDSKGFKLAEENRLYEDVTHRTNTVIDLVKGKLQPGATTDHEPALIYKRSRTPSVAGDAGGSDEEEEENAKDWDGIDLFVVVAPYTRSQEIQTATAFYTALRKNNINVSLVLTHAGDNKKSINLGQISHGCVNNYHVKEKVDEKRSAHFLRVLTDILFALERRPRGEANLSMRRKWQVSKDTYFQPALALVRRYWTHMIIMTLVALVIKIYVLSDDVVG